MVLPHEDGDDEPDRREQQHDGAHCSYEANDNALFMIIGLIRVGKGGDE